MSGAAAAAPSRRGLALAALFFGVLAAAPLALGDYALTVLFFILYLAYTGQAWNIMMGFAGQLSLGHALYVGLGAYLSAGLYVHYGVGPWLGLAASVVLAGLAGAVIGALAFRFRVGGVYFAILTIAFAEFARIGFDHLAWTGGTGGLFLPVAQRAQDDLVGLRGGPALFFWVMLALTALALALSAQLLRGRAGYYWQAIREDEAAAAACGIDVFRYKLYAVVLSAAMTAPAGVVTAFFYNNLFPEQVFSISRSIQIILGPIVGGVGTLFGPIAGSFLVAGLAEAMREGTRILDIGLPGLEQLVYGVLLLIVVMFLPGGIWPPIARRLGL